MANPNPSPETRFQPGNPGNPGGKTSEQRRLELANAEAATRVHAAMLAQLEAMLTAGEDGTAGKVEITSEHLKLIKDAQDRGLGAPTNKTAFTDAEGNDLPASIKLEIMRGNAEGS